MSRRISYTLGFVFLSVFSIVSTANAEDLPGGQVFPAAPGNPVANAKIGVIISQTGPLAPVGQGILNAIVLAAEQRDPGHAVSFIFEDDGLQPMRAVTAANKLISQDHVSALITFTGGMSAAVAPIAESRGIPLITIAVGDQHTIGKSLVYREYLSTEAQAEMLRAEAMRRGFHRLAIVTTTQESLIRLRQLFLKSAGEDIVADEEIPSSDTEVRSLAARVNARNPDAIILNLLPPQLGLFAKAARELGYTGIFLGGVQTHNFAEVAASQGALVGTIFPGPKGTPAVENFYREYEARFKQKIVSEQEVYGYDIASLLIAAIASGNCVHYLNELKEVRGLGGTYPRREHNFFEVPAVLKQIGSEKTVTALEITPEAAN